MTRHKIDLDALDGVGSAATRKKERSNESSPNRALTTLQGIPAARPQNNNAIGTPAHSHEGGPKRHKATLQGIPTAEKQPSKRAQPIVASPVAVAKAPPALPDAPEPTPEITTPSAREVAEQPTPPTFVATANEAGVGAPAATSGARREAGRRDPSPRAAGSRGNLWIGAVAAIAVVGLLVWLGSGLVGSESDAQSAVALDPGAVSASAARAPGGGAEVELAPTPAVDSPASVDVAPPPAEVTPPPAADVAPAATAVAPPPAEVTPPPPEVSPGAAEVEPSSEIVVTGFEVGSAVVPPRALRELGIGARDLLRCAAGVVVTGHTDNTGTEQSNHRLGEQRARTVAAALVELGIDGESIVRESAGSRRPVTNNDSAMERRGNRRVTVACE